MRLGEQRMVLGELTLRLSERRLIGPRVDLGEEVALLDHLAFGEAQFHQHPGDLGADCHRLERRDGAQRIEGDRHVAERDRRDPHALRRPLGRRRLHALARRRAGLLEFLPHEQRHSGERDDDRDPADKAASSRLRRLRLASGGGLLRRRSRGRRQALGHLRLEHFIHPLPQSGSPVAQEKRHDKSRRASQRAACILHAILIFPLGRSWRRKQGVAICLELGHKRLRERRRR